jgi:pimeloyl-ACP methyl ester carboxylesterase
VRRFGAFLVCCCVSLTGQTLQNGDYLGTAQIGAATLRMALHLAANPDGSWGGTIDSIDQGAMGIPIRNLILDHGAIRFGNFEGTVNSDGSEIAGRLMQGGAAVPIVFRKVAKIEGPARPQVPAKPYPYNEEEVEFDNQAAGVHIVGTLTWPKSGDGPFAAAILLSGSGALDRDETMFGHKPFLIIADYLTRRGFAVLRTDDRGVGKSTGSKARSTFEDLAQDAIAAAEFLRARKEIDPKRIGFIGHSQGGWIAPMAAGPAKAAFVILLAGPGVRGDELLYAQGQAVLKAVNAAPSVLERQSQLQHLLFGAVLAERDPTRLEARLREAITQFKASLSAQELTATPGFDQQMEGEVRQWMIPAMQSLIRHDPAPYLIKLHCPVLAMMGTLDTQVPAEQNLPAMAFALTRGAAEDYEVVRLPNLNHLFQTARTGAMSEYASIEETIAPLALETMGEWMKKRFPTAPRAQ